MNVTIRSESPADGAAIEAVIVAAFLDAPHTSHTEQFIVNALRESGQLTLSLVAENNDEIVGHAAVSPITISDGTCHWYGLGPVSVVPERQCRGIGTQLIEQAVSALRQMGADGCVVLGKPEYYRRFGFRAEPKLVLPDVPPECFQAVSFRERVPAGTVSYQNAFNGGV